MVTRLSNLNESLERLYSVPLEESVQSESLTEAYNETWPAWLKDRFSNIHAYHGELDPTRGYGKYKNLSTSERQAKYPKGGPTPDYTQPKGDYSDDMYKSIFQNALMQGIDLQNTPVIEGPVPEKRTDARCKAPNIPIWGLSNGQVYIPGVNDNEIYENMPYGSTYYNYAFKYIPTKYLISDSDKFAYIDGSALDPNAYFDKRQQRTDVRNELRELDDKDPTVGAYRAGRDPAQFSNRNRASKDKSGYPINPNRYKAALEAAGGKRIFKELDQRYEGLMEARDDIMAALGYYDPIEDTDMYEKLNDLLGYLRRAVSYYNTYLESAKGYADQLNSGEINQEMYNRYQGQVAKLLKEESYWAGLVSAGDAVFLAGADWLE